MGLKVKSKPASRINEKVKEPEDYKVILLNDNYTTMDFVVLVLMDIFHKNEAEANRIMLNVHKKGKGVAGVYTFDIAVTKTEHVHAIAKDMGFPLRCIIEPA